MVCTRESSWTLWDLTIIRPTFNRCRKKGLFFWNSCVFLNRIKVCTFFHPLRNFFYHTCFCVQSDILVKGATCKFCFICCTYTPHFLYLEILSLKIEEWLWVNPNISRLVVSLPKAWTESQKTSLQTGVYLQEASHRSSGWSCRRWDIWGWGQGKLLENMICPEKVILLTWGIFSLQDWCECQKIPGWQTRTR